MLSDISKSRRSEKRVHYGMEKHVRVRMSKKTFLIRDVNSADYQLSSLCKTVHIISHSYSHVLLSLHPSIFLPRKSTGLLHGKDIYVESIPQFGNK